MKTLTSRERMAGMSVTGWMFVIIVVVIFATAATKIIPAFMDYNTISGAIQNVMSDKRVGLLSDQEVRTDLWRRFNINNIDVLPVDDIEIIKENGQMTIRVDYEVRENFIKNIDFVISFKHDFTKSIR